MKNIFILVLSLYGVFAVPAGEAPVDATAELAEFTKGNHLFSANLYKEMNKDAKGNFVLSPFSAEVILALTNEGAVGDTSEQLQTGLSLPAKKAVTQKALKFFLPKLRTSDANLKLLSANKIFASKDVKPKENFKQVAEEIYQAGLENVDFAASEQAANTINQWVEEQTNHKIQNLVKKDYLNEDTKLVLVNALYFSGKWEKEFEKYATRKEKFYRTNDLTSGDEVDMMHQTDFFDYYDNRELKTKFIKLNYQGSNVSLVIALPDEIEGLTKLEQNIEKLLEPQPFSYERVDLKIPKFRIESEIQMKPILQQLGVKKLFSPEADLSDLIYPLEKPIYVDRVVQKTYIDVNEDGTEAAASTAVIVEDRIGTEQSFVKPLKLHINRPFLYYLTTDSVIAFIGRLNTVSGILPSKVETTTVKEVETTLTESANTSKNEGTKNSVSDISSTPEVPNPPEVDASTVATTLKVETTPKPETQSKNEIK